MPNIIESIGKWGVKTTELNSIRMNSPKPGDPVLMPNGSTARIDSVKTNSIGVCLGNASVFLNENATVNISGGPFESFDLIELECTGELKYVTFWNWGDNSPGADMGVYYHIARPLFKVISKN